MFSPLLLQATPEQFEPMLKRILRKLGPQGIHGRKKFLGAARLKRSSEVLGKTDSIVSEMPAGNPRG